MKDHMKTASLGPGLDVDVAQLVKSRLLVQANSGGGKSWTLRRLFEQTFGLVQHIIIDPEGEFYTLREKHDYALFGKGGGIPGMGGGAMGGAGGLPGLGGGAPDLSNLLKK